jgi:hypothetical protein
MNTRLILSLVLAALTCLSAAAAASAQWSDPGGTWAGPASSRILAAAAPAIPAPAQPEAPDVASDPAGTDAAPSVAASPELGALEESSLSSIVVAGRPPEPANPYENLPPGAILPSRPAVPDNPYDHLPPGVYVPRPAVPHPCRSFTPEWCPGGVYVADSG